MAFATLAPSTFAELISQTVNFAVNSLGWTDSSGATIVPKTGGATFALTEGGAAPLEDTDRGYWVKCDVTEGAQSFHCTLDTMPAVGQCWLFGGNAPEPWLHVVVSSAPGDYHHIYLGFLERYGDWTGGAIADATYWVRGTGYTFENRRSRWYDDYNHMLFSALDSGRFRWFPSGRQAGGVLVSHAGAPAPPGRFEGATSTLPGYPRDLGMYRIEGGVVDIGNRGLVIPGLTSFNGVEPLAPFVLRGDFEYDGFTVPLGAVAGIRMANIDDIDPEALLDFGGRTFQVFPLSNKFRATSVPNEYPWTIKRPAWQQGGSEYMGIAVLRE